MLLIAGFFKNMAITNYDGISTHNRANSEIFFLHALEPRAGFGQSEPLNIGRGRFAHFGLLGHIDGNDLMANTDLRQQLAATGRL